MSLSEKDTFQEALEDFRKRLHSTVPLRHFNEFYSTRKDIEDAAELEKSIVAEAFMWKVIDLSPSRIDELVSELDDEMQKSTDEWITKNDDHISRTESFLENIMSVLCDNYRTSLEAQLAMDPDVELEPMQKSVEDGKIPPLIYFKQRWQSGNADFYKKQKQKLEMKLDQVGQEFLEKKYFEKMFAEEEVRDQEAEIVREGNGKSTPRNGKRRHQENEESGASDDSASSKRQRILRTPSPKVVYVQRAAKSAARNQATSTAAASAKFATKARGKISLKLPPLSKVARTTTGFQKSQRKGPAEADAAPGNHPDGRPEESSDPPLRDPAKLPQQKKKGAKQLFAATP